MKEVIIKQLFNREITVWEDTVEDITIQYGEDTVIVEKGSLPELIAALQQFLPKEEGK